MSTRGESDDLPRLSKRVDEGAIVGLIRTALIFGAGYAVGDPNIRRQLWGKGQELAGRPEIRGLRDRGRDLGARITGRPGAGGGQGSGPTVTRGPGAAPDAGSPEFLERHNPVEKVSPQTTADAPATEAGVISSDPTRSER